MLNSCTAIKHCHFRRNETEDMLVYQSNSERVELFSDETTFFGFCDMLYRQKSRPVK